MLFWVCWSCQSPMVDNESNASFYEWEYVQKQAEDKLFLQFAPRTIPYGEVKQEDWDKWTALINSDATLQIYATGGGDWAFLETKNGNRISSATIEYFMANPVVGSASHPYFQYSSKSDRIGILRGVRNEFAAKLKETTSFAQLEQLAQQNHCTILWEDYYVKNQYFVTVFKTSELNAIQMSNLFYETGLFEYVQPTFVVLNLPGSLSCNDENILKVLEDEPAILRITSYEHAGRRVNAFCFELANYHFGSRWIRSMVDIPKQFRKEGLSVKISGNIMSCPVSLEGIDPYIRVAPTYFFEIKSIKINN